MVELDIEDILKRLRDLHSYSTELSRRLEHEVELPEYPALFLANKIEEACRGVETAAPAEQPAARAELCRWLVRSYRYYIARLALADNPWCFRFPSTQARPRQQ